MSVPVSRNKISMPLSRFFCFRVIFQVSLYKSTLQVVYVGIWRTIFIAELTVTHGYNSKCRIIDGV